MLTSCLRSATPDFWHKVINFVSLVSPLVVPKRKERVILLNPSLIKVMRVIFKYSTFFMCMLCVKKRSWTEALSSLPVFSAIKGGSIYCLKGFYCLDFLQFRIISIKLANAIYYLLGDIQLSQLTFLKIDPAVSFCTKSFHSPKNAVIVRMSSTELLKRPLGPALH